MIRTMLLYIYIIFIVCNYMSEIKCRVLLSLDEEINKKGKIADLDEPEVPPEIERDIEGKPTPLPEELEYMVICGAEALKQIMISACNLPTFAPPKDNLPGKLRESKDDQDDNDDDDDDQDKKFNDAIIDDLDDENGSDNDEDLVETAASFKYNLLENKGKEVLQMQKGLLQSINKNIKNPSLKKESKLIRKKRSKEARKKKRKKRKRTDGRKTKKKSRPKEEEEEEEDPTDSILSEDEDDILLDEEIVDAEEDDLTKTVKDLLQDVSTSPPILEEEKEEEEEKTEIKKKEEKTENKKKEEKTENKKKEEKTENKKKEYKTTEEKKTHDNRPPEELDEVITEDTDIDTRMFPPPLKKESVNGSLPGSEDIVRPPLMEEDSDGNDESLPNQVTPRKGQRKKKAKGYPDTPENIVEKCCQAPGCTTLDLWLVCNMDQDQMNSISNNFWSQYGKLRLSRRTWLP